MFAKIRPIVYALALTLVAAALAGAPARAQSLDDLRASGAVGEKFDGFLVARDPSAQAFVDQVNAKRKQIYAQSAAAQGAPADQVGRVYARRILNDAPAGTWFLGLDGKWVKK